MLIIRVFIGFAMLIMGRQLFWVVISGLGFVLGMSYATQFFSGSPGVILLVSLGAGAVGAILAYILQRAAAGLAGFLSGWYLTLILIRSFSLQLGEFSTIAALVGGILGAILIALMVDWTLIILSTLVGATIISQSIQFGPTISIGVFVVLLIMGLAVQSILYFQETDDFT